MQTQIKLLNSSAELPKRAHESDTGYDIKLISVNKIEGDVIYFGTGIALTPPKNYYWEIYPRSSISKFPITLANGTGIIDEQYTGELLIAVRVLHPGQGLEDNKSTYNPTGFVKFLKHKPQSFSDLGQIILQEKPYLFQLILRERLNSDFKIVDELKTTVRGAGGFGSTK